jgi:hypothetical protein
MSERIACRILMGKVATWKDQEGYEKIILRQILGK